MKKGFVVIVLLLNSTLVFAQNEIGPEGHKLLWILFFILASIAAFLLVVKPFKTRTKTKSKPFFSRKKLKIDLHKDAVYYPDNLLLKVTNTGNSDVDLDQPLLVFDNFWLKRKFKLKGVGKHSFYPLYLEKGKTHTLQIDLTRFYSHDKSLKKFPKAKVYLSEVKGKKLGSQSVFLRKTLFKY